jgi:hypothetical protein
MSGLVYYYGCANDDAGHFLWAPDRSSRFGLEGVRNFRMAQPWGVGIDGPIEADFPQTQGKAHLHYRDGWTALWFWDRSVDSRPGSHSTFIAEGTLSLEAMLVLARERFPEVWARYKFEVVPTAQALASEPECGGCAEVKHCGGLMFGHHACARKDDPQLVVTHGEPSGSEGGD